MLAMELRLRAYARRHPRFAQALMGLIRRSPRLSRFCVRRYGLRLLQPPPSNTGYRHPLPESLDALTPRARELARQLDPHSRENA
ncbi:hypothetical protein [Ectothiorhodospira mobilis]|uniref:hypothetical protein n=1 Tax=Ectothiorhodospira mobilis TaxID=195064 RepID=UPI001EE8C617|nr:hypothetical protein [Ectothiorhodospira mobilis]MCG5534669.1 hypothetical protein [Ectothiorhodospira mobilis]